MTITPDRVRANGRLDWATIIDQGAAIVESYSTAVTLRQLHYRLVAASIGGYRNELGCYKQLSARTAELRRDGLFPSLADTGRGVDQPYHFDNAAEALSTIAQGYRLDRTSGQDYQTWVLFEKATLNAQLASWTSPHGIPMAAMRGYSSESLEREIFDRVQADGRPAVCWYVGDLDPEGEDVERNFQDQAARAGVWFEHWQRLAVTPDQIDELGLVPNPGKESSSRAAGFIRKYGDLFQIETEAIDPAVLQALITEAILNPDWFDETIYDDVVARERRERERLERLVEDWDAEHDDEDGE